MCASVHAPLIGFSSSFASANHEACSKNAAHERHNVVVFL